jgi:hypothetical protein
MTLEISTVASFCSLGFSWSRYSIINEVTLGMKSPPVYYDDPTNEIMHWRRHYRYECERLTS